MSSRLSGVCSAGKAGSAGFTRFPYAIALWFTTANFT